MTRTPLLREPLVYFVLLGALVFAVDAGLRRDPETIRITPAVRAELARSFEARQGRPPDADEARAELEHWKAEQALYREGVKLGLEDDDPVIRAHVAGKLLQVARDRDVLPEPTDVELRAFFEQNRSRFSTPATFDFEQVFVSRTHDDARAQADSLLAKLRAGAAPDGLGDWFPRGTRFQGETQADVALLLGDEAAQAMPGYAVGEWHLVRGPTGFHAVRVTAAASGAPRFEDIRRSLVLAFQADLRERAAREYARQVESHYRYVESP